MRPARKPTQRYPVDITDEMEAYFGLVEIGREFSIQGLMHDGFTRSQAEAESGRRMRLDFNRKEEISFSARFPEAKIWQ